MADHRVVRILCNGFGWFDAAADVATHDHDVVRLDDETLYALWTHRASDWWRSVVPPGWVPDVALFCCPEYRLMPPVLAGLPCPVALWVGDWYAGAQAVHALAGQSDLILADATGVRALRGSGIEHVDECCPWTFDPELHRPDWDAEAEWEVGFLGNLNDAIQHERNAWLARVAALPAEYRIYAGGGLYGDDYVRFTQRTRITFNRSVTGDVNMRCFEGTACGSLVLIERGNSEVARWFEPGREIVEYDEHDFAAVVEHYLSHDDERRAIARAGWARVQQYAPEPRLRALLARLGELAAGGVTRATRDSTPRACADSAMQAMTVVSGRPWGGIEAMLNGARAATPERARVEALQGVLYTELAGSVREPEQAARLVQAAFAHEEQAIELDPSDAVAHLNRAAIAAAVGDAPTARVLAHDVIERIESGAAYARPDRLVYPLAVSRERIALQAAILAGDGVQDRLTRQALAAAHRIAGTHGASADERIEHWTHSLEHADSPDVRLAIAAALRDSGRVDAALEHLEVLLHERPVDPDAWMAFVGALCGAGRHEEARAFVDRARRLVARLTMDETDVIQRLELAVCRTASAAA